MTTTKQTLDTWKNLTTWGEPKSTLQSQYGNTTYREWCEKEVVRMRANGGQAVVVEMDGMVAVARP
jgi:hypothetical protein